MWFFRDRSAPDLEERVEKIERRLKEVTLEWEDFYEKARRLVWRQRARKREEAPIDEETAVQPRPGLDPISQRILAQRNRKWAGTSGGS